MRWARAKRASLLSLPGYRKFDNPEDREDLAALWNIDVDHIPKARGLAYPDIIEGAVTGKIKALWFIATNPAVSFPNYSVLEQALRSVEFLVVQDGFHPTPTSDFADLVLPAAIWGEKEGTYTNSERRVSKAIALVSPPGEARSDFDIFLDLAERLGVRQELYPGWTTTHDAFRNGSASPLDACATTAISPGSEIEEQAACSGAANVSTQTESSPRPTDEPCCISVPCVPFIEQPNKEYDLILNTGRTVEHWHTRTKTAQVRHAQQAWCPNAWLEMNPVDANAP